MSVRVSEENLCNYAGGSLRHGPYFSLCLHVLSQFNAYTLKVLSKFNTWMGG